MTTCMNSEDMVSEISQTEKDKYCLILLYEVSKITKFIKSNWNGGYQGLEVRRK